VWIEEKQENHSKAFALTALEEITCATKTNHHEEPNMAHQQNENRGP
jgi:hypothetical protein